MLFCECGCGHQIKNKKRRFLQGHWAKTMTGRLLISQVRLAGTPTNHGDGYYTQNAGFQQGNILSHRLIAEKALGKPLPKSAKIHHVDEQQGRINPSALVICPDDAYHQLLHLRARALRECGHASWRKCSFCQKWDKPENLYIPPNKGTVEHRQCGNAYRKQRAATKKAVREAIS